MKAVKLQIVAVLLYFAFLPGFAMGNAGWRAPGVVGKLLQHSSPASDTTPTDLNGALLHATTATGIEKSPGQTRRLRLAWWRHSRPVPPAPRLRVQQHEIIGNLESIFSIAIRAKPLMPAGSTTYCAVPHPCDSDLAIPHLRAAPCRRRLASEAVARPCC
jgi:hypothetical protein